MKTLQEKKIEKLEEALNKIANPIAWMQNDANKRGLRLDGQWAIQLASDHNWLRKIATDCLSELAALDKEIEQGEQRKSAEESYLDFFGVKPIKDGTTINQSVIKFAEQYASQSNGYPEEFVEWLIKGYHIEWRNSSAKFVYNYYLINIKDK